MEEKPKHMEDSNEEVEGTNEIVEDSLSDDLSYEDGEVASEEDESQFEASEHEFANFNLCIW